MREKLINYGLRFVVHEKNKGFILLITLLIISVISLLLLTSMQHILLYYKAINKYEVVHHRFYQLEDVALQLTRIRPQGEGSCFLSEDAANQVLQSLHYQGGCSFVNGLIHYKYFIEDLGAFPCLVVKHKGRKYATYHQRISVVRVEEGIATSFLQIRFISIGGASGCLSNDHYVNLGVSSWRYFSSL